MILGVILIALGCLGLVYQGITFWTRKKVVDAGPLQVDATTPTTVWIPPALSAVLIALGIVALLFSRVP